MPALRTTLDCKDAESWLSAWLDRELAGDDRVLLETHLTSCRACREKGELLVRLKDALRQGALLSHHAPDRLVQSVVTGVRSEARRRAARTAAVTAVVVVALAGGSAVVWQATPPRPVVDALRPVMKETAERHQLDVPVDVASPDPARVEAFLKPRVGHAIAVPRLDAHGYGLLGGRIVDVMNKRAAQLVYMGGLGRRISVLAVPDAALAQDVHGRRRGTAEGMPVEVFERQGVVYSIVGDLDAERLANVVDSFGAATSTTGAVQTAAYR